MDVERTGVRKRRKGETLIRPDRNFTFSVKKKKKLNGGIEIFAYTSLRARVYLASSLRDQNTRFTASIFPRRFLQRSNVGRTLTDHGVGEETRLRRCQQIRIRGPHRGRSARHREIKFDRSAPLLLHLLPLFFHRPPPFLDSYARLESKRRERERTFGRFGRERWKMALLAPTGCPTGIQQPPAPRMVPPPYTGPYTPFYTILFYLPLPCRRLRSLGARSSSGPP